MNVLWITNIIFPEAAISLQQKGDFCTSGGWMLASAERLLTLCPDIHLAVATVSSLVKDLTIINGKQITYFIIPLGKGNTFINEEYNPYWKLIYEQFHPDITHIHGTEFSHAFSYLLTCGNKNTVISIQGLLSVCSRFILYGLHSRLIVKSITFLDVLKKTSLFHLKRKMEKQGEYEKLMLKGVKHVIGRTTWDKAHVWAVNPSARYHFCNETLRSVFYDGCWKYDTCSKHTIFLSQASTPIKGIQQLIKALPLILRHYPDTRVRIGGWNPTLADTFNQKIRLSGFGNYIRIQLKKYNLEDCVSFLGNLSAEEMKQELLNSNLFLMPSSIENSPNSLGEAQLLGVPCVVANVGGVEDMVPNSSCGTVYRFDEVELLAYSICETFKSSVTFDNTIMRSTALARHNPQKNALDLLNIYNHIINTND